MKRRDEEARLGGGPARPRPLSKQPVSRIHLMLARYKAWRTRVCAICGERIDHDDRMLWSRFRVGYIHDYCVPAIVSAMGEEQVRIWLRYGSEAFFPTQMNQQERRRTA